MSECDQLRAELARIRNEVSGLKSKVDEAQSTADEAYTIGVAAAAKALAALTLATTAQAKATAAAASALDALGLAEFVLGQLQQYVTNVRLRVLENRLNVIEAFQNTLIGLIERLKRRVDSHERRIKKNEEDIEDNSIQIASLSVTVNAFIAFARSKFRDIDGKLELLFNKVEKLIADFIGLVLRVRALEQKIPLIETALELLRNDVNFLQSAVNGILQRLAPLEAEVEKLIQDVIQINLKLRALEDLFNKLKSDFEKLLRDVIALSERVGRLSQSIGKVEQIARKALAVALKALRREFPPHSHDGGDGNSEEDTKRDRVNDKLLREIFQRVSRIEYVVGARTDFPAVLPENLTDANPGSVSLKTIPQLIAHVYKEVDELSGQYPLKLEIADADLNEEGNQTQVVELFNQSEALAEVYGLSYEANLNSQLLINMLVRLIPEVLATKNATFIGQDYTKAITNWLGFRTKAVEREIPSNFNLDARGNIDEFLSESVGKLPGIEDDDPYILVQWLQHMKYALTILKASNFRGKEELEELNEEIDSFKAMDGEEASKAWDDFLDKLNSFSSPNNLRSPFPRPKVVEVDNPLDPDSVIPEA